MEKRELGRTGLMVTTCCLGTMTWGQQNTEVEGHAQMDYAMDRGINFWDTAEMYSVPPKAETQGSTERIIGSWFKKTGRRDEIILASKVSGRSKQTWTRDADVEWTRHTKAQIDEAVAKSLKRLQTDYIDLYQLHWPDRPVGLFGARMDHKAYGLEYEAFEEILDHLDSHIKAGRLRHVGLSNETPFGVMRFIAESEARGLPRMASIQNAYNLVNRTFEDGGLEEACLREDVSLLAYSPLGQGYLTGKYRNGALPEGSRKKLFNRLQRYESPAADRAIESYLVMAENFGVDPTQLAIKFCDTRPFMTSTIIGATNMDQLKTCIDAFDMAWSDELEAEVNRLHMQQPSPCP
ncbi:MAG: aldo/keto reductase [Alphaproteobacteria bacterium]|nr:aldo/keto reductase [Alphaproteobacteria bacterium]